MQTLIMDDPIRFNMELPSVPQKYIPLLDLIAVAWVMLFGASGGLASAGFEALKTRKYPQFKKLVVFFGVGGISAIIAFSSTSLASFMLPSGAVDWLRLAGFSATAGFFAGLTAVGLTTGFLHRVLGEFDGEKKP